jgi:hypothetical protein
VAFRLLAARCGEASLDATRARACARRLAASQMTPPSRTASRSHAAAVLVVALVAVCFSAVAPPTAALQVLGVGDDDAAAGARRALQQSSSTTATHEHAFDFTSELVADAGAAVVPWAVSAAAPAALSYEGLSLTGSGAGVTITPDALVQGKMTVHVTGRYSTTGDDIIRTVFNLDGVAFRVAPFNITVGDGIRVHNFADVANTNGASVRCSQVWAVCCTAAPSRPTRVCNL